MNNLSRHILRFPSPSRRFMRNFFGLCLSVCFLITTAGTAAYAIDGADTTDAVPTQSKEEKKETTGRNLESLSEALETLTAQIKAISGENAKIRETQADRGADMTDLRERLEKITGQIEVLTKDMSSVKTYMDTLNARVSSIEKMLDLDTNKASNKLQKDSEKEKLKDMDRGKENGDETTPLPDKDTLYETALKHFKEERFESARRQFETYLARYGDSDQAANAMFWICECHYFEGNFEKAALAYETLIKTHPESDKIPAALFKQGLCFLKLGDKTTAKLLFQQVLAKYPQTSHAAMARVKLKEMEEKATEEKAIDGHSPAKLKETDEKSIDTPSTEKPKEMEEKAINAPSLEKPKETDEKAIDTPSAEKPKETEEKAINAPSKAELKNDPTSAGKAVMETGNDVKP